MAIWNSFICKTGDDVESFSPEQIEELDSRDANGWQMKNAARTAHSLVLRAFKYLQLTLDAIDDSTREVNKGRQDEK